ncbi:DUF3324 domain-containing protein [Enterococcus faecalis]|nr:DUF3324 domain-containing protein [Enterococcus faecalis]
MNVWNFINATLKKPQPTYINQLSMKAKITKKGKKKVYLHMKKMQMVRIRLLCIQLP